MQTLTAAKWFAYVNSFEEKNLHLLHVRLCPPLHLVHLHQRIPDRHHPGRQRGRARALERGGRLQLGLRRLGRGMGRGQLGPAQLQL